MLEEHLDQVTGLAFLQPYMGVTIGTLCTAGAVALAVGDLGEAPDARWYTVGATAGCAAGSVASYLAPIDYQAPVVMASLTTGLALDLVFLTHFADSATPAIRVSMFSWAGGTAALGILGLVDVALRPPVSSTRLRAHMREIKSRGGRLTRAEVARMEADLEAFSNRPVPRWAYGAALLAAGVVAYTPTFASGSSDDDKDFAIAAGLAMSGIGVMGITTALLQRNLGYPSYIEALKAVDLVPIGPEGSTGLWAVGQF